MLINSCLTPPVLGPDTSIARRPWPFSFSWRRPVAQKQPKKSRHGLLQINHRCWLYRNLGTNADGSHFENSIRFYKNVGSGTSNGEPQFSDPEGVIILRAESPQMISGADAVDWNGDRDIDLLTGQGHGGSGLRFYERDWLEDEMRGTHPAVKVLNVETKSAQP
jgi:hypothetical protein